MSADSGGLMPDIPDQASLSSQAATSANAQREKFAEAKNSGRTLYPMPNGDFGFLDEDEEYLAHAYQSGKHMSTLSNAKGLLENPREDCVYVWAARLTPRGDKANPQTVAQVRAGRYRPVTAEELRENIDTPVERFRIAGFEDVVGIVDVVLMEVNPQAQRELYKWRTMLAKTRTNRWQAFGDLKSKVEAASGGLASASLEVKKG